MLVNLYLCVCVCVCVCVCGCRELAAKEKFNSLVSESSKEVSK